MATTGGRASWKRVSCPLLQVFRFSAGGFESIGVCRHFRGAGVGSEEGLSAAVDSSLDLLKVPCLRGCLPSGA